MSKKYKGVFRDKKGRIYCQTEFKLSATGKRQRFKRYRNKWGKSFKTEKEAYDELCRARVDFYDKYDYSDYNLTFAQFMEDIFLPYYKQTVQISTYNTAITHFNTFIEVFGNKKLRDIKTRDCEKFRLELIDKYSANYAKCVWIRFKQCLGYAERMEYIKTFPCKSLDNPKGKRPDTKFWTFEEFKKVISTFNLKDYEDIHRFTVIWVYYMTGVRVSEGFSLIWSDFDLENQRLFVHSTLEVFKGGIYQRKEQTKTDAGIRFIDLDDETVKVLNRWRKVQISNSDDDYILSKFGSPMIKSTLTRMLKRHAKLAGVPEITGKGLRHSHDSFLINVLGKDVLSVSQRSGRIDKATTLNTYSHFYNVNKQTIGSEITDLLQKEGVTSTPR
ncbi:tyrosine-type recombinase/integrase [Streptococcus uberis]|uniref:tyrosine-type recombinase/integrase n=1 Tax=Streptococcus uberis TaxID=1349 RepID=UPI001FF16B29|nr:site-specific integrase [Streptococcus uberis]MCK1157646.1 site-specific integrase [Streptococcus uberis]MCK1250925.1 site-specific integrase [Streptococcus uberis]